MPYISLSAKLRTTGTEARPEKSETPPHFAHPLKWSPNLPLKSGKRKTVTSLRSRTAPKQAPCHRPFQSQLHPATRLSPAGEKTLRREFRQAISSTDLKRSSAIDQLAGARQFRKQRPFLSGLFQRRHEIWCRRFRVRQRQQAPSEVRIKAMPVTGLLDTTDKGRSEPDKLAPACRWRLSGSALRQARAKSRRREWTARRRRLKKVLDSPKTTVRLKSS